MPSPNLGVTYVSASQNQKEVTINSAIDALDNASNATLVLTLSAATTLTAAQFAAAATFVCTGLTADQALTVPLSKRLFVVSNPSAHQVTVGGASGATVAVPSGMTQWVLCDGTNCSGVGSASAATRFTSLTDVPNSYAGAGGLPVRVNAAGTALEFRAFSVSDISGAEGTANKGQANGYAGLGSDGKVPASQLPASVAGALSFAGTWDASANSPALTNTPGANGIFYVVGTAGTTSITTRAGTVTQWNVGDLIFSDGTYWDKLDGQPTEVVSVAGKTGAVTLSHTDISDWSSATASFGAGTVTSVGLSVPNVLYTVSGGPITGSGTLTFTLIAQAANTVFAGPSSGASAAPTFRSLVAADIPRLTWAQLPTESQNLPLGFVLPSKPNAGQTYNLVMAMAVTIPANLAGTVCYANIPPTANATFTINKISGNGSTLIGTATLAAGSSSALTFSTQGAVSLGVNDVLQLVCPATQDATLADIGLTILAAKV